MAAEISKPDFSYQWSSGGSIVAPSNVKIQTGWTAEVPPFQWENWSQNRQDNAILHLFQKGISEWDAASNYYFTASGVRSYVQGSDGQVYVAVSDSLNQNPVTDATHTYWKLAFSEQAGHGRCKLSVSSTTTLLLLPYNGNGVIVNGITLQIPAGGVTYTISGLVASTVYYVYLAGTTAAPVLNLSTTAYVTGTNGVVVKSGDATQTLVGMVYTNASTQFVDTALSRTCINWFNRRKIISDIAVQPGYTFSNTTTAEINTALRLTFLCWADDVPFVSASGCFSMNVQGTVTLATSVDTVGNQYTPSQNTTVIAGGSSGFSGHGALGLTEGRHFTLLVGNINVSGTATVVNIQTIVQVNG